MWNMDSVAPKAMGQVCTFTLLEIGGISGGIVPDLNRPRTPSKKEIVWSVAQGARKCDCDTQDRTNASGFQSCRSARAANSIVDHTAFITYGCQLETVPASLHPPWFLLYHFSVGYITALAASDVLMCQLRFNTRSVQTAESSILGLLRGCAPELWNMLTIRVSGLYAVTD